LEQTFPKRCRSTEKSLKTKQQWQDSKRDALLIFLTAITWRFLTRKDPYMTPTIKNF